MKFGKKTVFSKIPIGRCFIEKGCCGVYLKTCAVGGLHIADDYFDAFNAPHRDITKIGSDYFLRSSIVYKMSLRDQRNWIDTSYKPK